MVLYQDVFKWKGWGNGVGNWESKCYLQVFYNDGKLIGICSDLGPGSGTSVTNCADNVATLVYKHIIETQAFILSGLTRGKGSRANTTISPEDFIMFERTPASINGEGKGDTYDVVSLTWNGKAFVAPVWKRSQLETVERLIGEPIFEGGAENE